MIALYFNYQTEINENIMPKILYLTYKNFIFKKKIPKA